MNLIFYLCNIILNLHKFQSQLTMNNIPSKNKKNKSTAFAINIDRESIAILILKKDNFHLANE